MLPWSADLAGQIYEHVISSELLRGNPLGDPHERPLLVYMPPGYGHEPGRRYPVVYVIQGYTGYVTMWRNRTAYRQPFPETADAMFARGDAPPAIVAYVDAWTAYGGSQYVDSPGTGRYHSYLCDEVVPYVDARYRTIPDAAHRAIMGKSSGGFGAMITPMLRPDLFGALATHAGDSLYEYSYVPSFPAAVRHLRKYDGDIFRWWDDFRSRVSFTKPEDMSLFELLGIAACFSARGDGTPELPFDPVTGVLRPPVWQRWLDWDPVRMVPRYAAALRGLRGIWIDAGTRDEYNLDVGATAFRAALLDAGVAEDLIHFELFDATHAAIDYRYPLSLAWLCKGIAELARPTAVVPPSWTSRVSRKLIFPGDAAVSTLRSELPFPARGRRCPMPSLPPAAAAEPESDDPLGIRYPNTARVWNYHLRGKDNFEVDRRAAAAVEAMSVKIGVPLAAETAIEGRHLLQRMVDYMLGQGIRQFLDLGSGLPSMANTHQIAHRAAPDARVVYVDTDPMVSSHASARMAGSNVVALRADLRDPEQVLTSPVVRDALDFGQPVGIMFICVLHCLWDKEDPWAVVRQFRDAVPSGSHLALSHMTNEVHPQGAQALFQMTQDLHWNTPLISRSRADIMRYFDGFELADPGLVSPAQWRPDLDNPLRSAQEDDGDEAPVLRLVVPERSQDDRGAEWHLCGVGVKP